MAFLPRILPFASRSASALRASGMKTVVPVSAIAATENALKLSNFLTDLPQRHYTSAAELKKMAVRVKKMPAFKPDPKAASEVKSAVDRKATPAEKLTLSQAAAKHDPTITKELDELNSMIIPPWYKETDPFPYPDNVKSLAAEVKKLSLNEMMYLCQVLKEEFELTDDMIANAGSAVASAGGSGETKKEEAKPKEKTDFSVKLEGYPADAKLKVVKQVRLVMPELSIVEAKNIVEGVPKVLKEKVSKEDAAKIKAKMEEVGAKIVVE